MTDWLAGNAIELLTLAVAVLGALAGAGYFRWRRVDKTRRYLSQQVDALEAASTKMRDQRDAAWRRLQQVDPKVFLDKIAEARADHDPERELRLATDFFHARSPAIAEAARILAEDNMLGERDGEVSVLEALRYVQIGLSARPGNKPLEALRDDLTARKTAYERGADSPEAPLDRLDAKALNELSIRLYTQGRYASAELAARRCADAVYRVHGGTSTEFATVVGQHAVALEALGQDKNAEPLFRKAVEVSRKALGETHPAYAQSLHNLAGLLRRTGQIEEAEPLLRQAADIRKVALGESDPDYASSLNSLAALLRDKGDDEAEHLFRRALAIQKAALGEANPVYAQTLHNLAVQLYDTGRSEEAEALLKQAVTIRKSDQGETHPDYARSLNDLAALLKATGRQDEAEPLFEQAIEVAEAALGADHPTTRHIRQTRNARENTDAGG